MNYTIEVEPGTLDCPPLDPTSSGNILRAIAVLGSVIAVCLALVAVIAVRRKRIGGRGRIKGRGGSEK